MQLSNLPFSLWQLKFWNALISAWSRHFLGALYTPVWFKDIVCCHSKLCNNWSPFTRINSDLRLITVRGRLYLVFCWRFKPVLSFCKSIWARRLVHWVCKLVTDRFWLVIKARTRQFLLRSKIVVVSTIVSHSVPEQTISYWIHSTFFSKRFRSIVVSWCRRCNFFFYWIYFFVDVNLLNLITTYSKRLTMAAAHVERESPICSLVCGWTRQFSMFLTGVVVFETCLSSVELGLGFTIMVKFTFHVYCTCRDLSCSLLNLRESISFWELMCLFRRRIIHKGCAC